MQKKYYNPLMSTETMTAKEISKQRVEEFLSNLHPVKFDNLGKGTKDLDTFFLVTYDQSKKEDTVDFVSWAGDTSRSYPSNYVSFIASLQLPKNKDHPAFPNKFTIPDEGKRVPVIAFGTGPGGKSFLFQLKGMNTKPAFERLKKLIGAYPPRG